MMLKDDKQGDGRLSMWHFKGWLLSVKEDNNRHPNIMLPLNICFGPIHICLTLFPKPRLIFIMDDT